MAYPLWQKCLDMSSLEMAFVRNPGDGVSTKGQAGGPFGVCHDRLHFFPPIILSWASLHWAMVACWARPASNLQRQKASRWKEIVHKCPFLHHLKICFCSSGGASKMTPNNLLLGGIASRTSCTLHAIIIIIPLHKLRQRLLGSSGW